MFLRTAAFLCALLLVSAGKAGASEPFIPGRPLLPRQEEIRPPYEATIGAPDLTGVFRPSNGALYLKATNSSGFADAFLTYGLPGDYPITGDWNGDGVDTIGIYRNGTFYLRNSNTNGFANLVFAFGGPGDQPVAGDWDGDGVTTIGVYRNGTFYLRNSNTSGPADLVFGLGIAGDIGIAGDWDGDGTVTTGVFRPSNGALYLKNSNTTGFADIILTYGLPGDLPVTGDWDGDGIDTIGVYRDGTFFLRNSNTNGVADLEFALGTEGDRPIAGRWKLPFLSSLSPASGHQAEVLRVNITGEFTNFADGASQVSFGPGIVVDLVSVFAATSLGARVSIAADAVAGKRTVTVTTGAEVARAFDGFTVLAGDITSPMVSRTSPSHGASGVPINTRVTVEFSERMDPGTLNQANFTIRDNTNFQNVAGLVQVEANGRFVSFVPNQPFAVGRSFTVTLNFEIKDVAGNRLNYQSFSFSTGFVPDNNRPSMTGISPSYAESNVPINAEVVLQFSEPLNDVNAHRGIQVSHGGQVVPGAIDLSDGNRRITFTPEKPFPVNTTFTVTRTAQITDLAGNTLTNPASTIFTTGTASVLIPPLVRVDPEPSANGVGTNAVVRIQASQRINPLTLNDTTFVVSVFGTRVRVAGAIAVAADRRSATFTPSSALVPLTLYYVEVFSVRDLVGHSISISSTFTTGPGQDTVRPTVVALSPAPASTGVPVNARVVALLSEPVSGLSVGSNAIVLLAGTTPVPGSFILSSDGRALTFRPTNFLAISTAYTVSVSGFADTTGNVVAPFTSGFTTAASGIADTTAPVVTAVEPADGATGVPTNSRIVLTFSERIAAGTVNNYTFDFLIDGIRGLVAGSYSVNGAIVTFTPASPLPASTRLVVRVSGVLDLAGNVNTSFTSSFDTGEATDSTAPEVILVTPSDGAAGVSSNVAVVLTFSEPLHPKTIHSFSAALFAGGSRLYPDFIISADNRTVTMIASSLPAADLITVVVTQEVTDLAGNHLKDFQSQFTTASSDFNQPSVVSQRPGNGASGVAVNSSVVLYVNEPLKQTTIAGALHVSQNGVLANGMIRVTGNGQAIEFVPAAAWVKDAIIQVFLDNKAQDLAGNPLINNYQGSFRTVSDTSASAPIVVRSVPAPGTAGAPLNPVIEVEYNEPLDPATINGTNVSLRVNSSGNVIASAVSLREGRIIRIVPGAPLAANTSYNYRITTGIHDLDGSAPASNFQALFTTGNSADNASPRVVGVTPPQGAGNVGTNANIRVFFDESINPITVSGETIRVSDGTSAAIPCAISFSNGDREVLLVPYAPLPDARLMTLTVSGVEDLAGHAATPKTTQFTTRAGPDTAAPLVVRTNPVSGATDVPVNTAITFEVNEPIDPLSLNGLSLQVFDSSAGQVAGSYSVSSDGRRVSFVPDGPLAVGRNFSALFGGVLDLAGNFLSGYENVSFTTAFVADTVGPQVLGVSPANGLTQVPINAHVMIVFNEPIQNLSVDQVTLSTGGVSLSLIRRLSDGNRTLTLTPLVPLAPLKVHTVSVAGVKDIAGNLLPAPVTTSFTTGAGADLTPMEVTVDPESGATGVGTNAVVRLRFSDRINPLTLNDTTFTVTSGTVGPLAGAIAVAADRRSAVFTPSSGFTPLTTFAVQGIGLTDLVGNEFSVYCIFTTGTGPDTLRPTVVVVSPAPASTSVPVNAHVVALLSESVSYSSVSNSAIMLYAGTTPVPGSVARRYDRRTLTFTPTNKLAVSTTFTVTISGLTDDTGNVVVPFTSNFTTGASGVADTTAPVVTAVDPPNGATGVATNRSIVLTFSERIAAANIVNNDAFAIWVDGISGLVAGNYSVSGATVTFTPASPLPGSARVRVGAGGVLDLAGNSSASFSSFFDTGAATDFTAPEVILVTPSDGAADVNPNTFVVLTFSEPLNPNTINHHNFALFAGGSRLDANLIISADNRTVTMIALSLPAESVVAVVVTRDVRDLSGNRLLDFRSAFTTTAASDLDRPSVVSQRPGNGSSGVGVHSSVVLYVNEPLNQTTIAGALHISQNGVLVNGTIRVTGNGQAIEFVPAAALAKNVLIQVFLDNKAQDVAGNALNNYQGSFRTVSDTGASAPAVVRSIPASGTTGAPLNPVIEVEFNEPLNPATINGTNVSLRANIGGNVIASAVSLREGRIIRVVPGTPLATNTIYTYRITTGIRDLDGTAPTSNFQASFTTGNSADNANPRVIGVSPPDGAVNIGTNANIRVFFDESINPITVGGATIRVSDGTSTVIPCAINFSNGDREMLLVPHAPLPDARLMTLTVSGVEDLAGHAVTPKTTQFTTRTGPDVIAPVVLRTNPFSNATDVPVNTVLTLEVNEPIEPLSVNGFSFEVYESGPGRVAGSYSVSSDGRIVNFVPDVPLTGARTYAVSSSTAKILDLAGNGLGYFYINFTTAPAADSDAPQIVGVSPSNGLSQVPINAQVVITFNEPIQSLSVDQVTLSADSVSLSVIRSLSNGNRTLTLSPLVFMAPLKVHTVSIAGVKDLAGNLLAVPLVTTFTTGTSVDLSRPSATVVDPGSDATGVDTNTVVRIQFSEPINPLTIDDTTFLVISNSTGIRIAGAVAVAPDGRSAVFTPFSALDPSTTYRVEVFTITDFTGIQASFSSSFTTGQ